MRHLGQGLGINPPRHRRFAGMAGELLEQLEIRKAQAHHLDPSQDLVAARPKDRLGGVQLQPVGSDQLHCLLRLRNLVCCHCREICFVNVAFG